MADPLVTLDEQLKCVRRELALRRSAYPKWVKAGRMKAAEADREIQAMEAVLGTLAAAAEGLPFDPEAAHGEDLRP
jgi:hypothetical protein